MRHRTDILSELREYPDVVLLMQEVQQILSQESEKRKGFRELIHENVKAEFINGDIIYHSPVRRRHWKTVGNLYAAMHRHVQQNNLGEVGSEKVMISLTRNDYEPDLVFFTQEKVATFTTEQVLFPAPDFVAEVLSESTEKYDRNEKFVDYAAHGVQEYWIIDPEQQTVEKYLNHNNRFELFEKLHKGSIESATIKNFSILIADIFA